MSMNIASVPMYSASALPIDHFRRDVASIAFLFNIEVFCLEAFTCAMLNMLTFGTLEVALAGCAGLQLSILPGADVLRVLMLAFTFH